MQYRDTASHYSTSSNHHGLSYLGFFVIPVLSVVLVLAGLYGHYLRHDRLTDKLTLASDMNAWQVTNAHTQPINQALHVLRVNDTSANAVLHWRYPLAISPEFYERIDIALIFPNNYRGLTLDYVTQNDEQRTTPLLYAVNNKATVRLPDLLDNGELLTSLTLTLHHELMSPLVVESVTVVPKPSSVEQFMRLVRLNLLSGNVFLREQTSLTPQTTLFAPLLFFVLVGGVMMCLMLLVYARPLGGVVCVFSSLTITMISMGAVLLGQLGDALLHAPHSKTVGTELNKAHVLLSHKATSKGIVRTEATNEVTAETKNHASNNTTNRTMATWIDTQKQTWDWLTPAEKRTKNGKRPTRQAQ